MSQDIRIKKGLNIRLKGEAAATTKKALPSNVYAIKLDDFHGVTPKLAVKVGGKVQAGSPVFFNKAIPAMQFVSPVSGEIVEIERGERRRVLTIKIQADKEQVYADYGAFQVENADTEAVKSQLLQTGCWPFIEQRPYAVIADPSREPKAIFISAHATAPLAANYEHVLADKQEDIQLAIDALGKLTSGNIHVGVGNKANSVFSGVNGISLHQISGPHPAGNVGTMINKLNPVNKGEAVWTVNPQDLVIIGEMLRTGKFNAERTIALAGSAVKNPQYYTTKIGAEVATFVYDSGLHQENVRIIDGNVLSGTKVANDGFLGYYNNVVTVIPEGNDYELFGWLKPVFNKLSTSRALTFSWLNGKKEYDLNTNTNGEHRAFVVTGSYEEVFPLDIYPMQILKSCMYKDLDEMEALGMYEVAPEDFALTEFICVSKQPHQHIIREGLDLMLKEIG
ncbi:MAG: Na(+)-translocating NADH-quinone reductase subunit A [Flavobacteriaceae bacterium]|nr:Na(+)-translocating NADH-quinone reductase subunit A [Flavobacteriaceae bacterium]